LPATRMAPMVRVRAAVQPAALASALEPWAEALAWLGARNRQERARNLRLWSDLLRTQDGTLVWEGDPVDGPTRCLTGTRDPKTSAGLLVDPDYARMVRSTAMFGPMTEARIDARSSEHRGVGIWKMTVSSIFDSSATQDDRATYRAVAGWLDLHTRAASLAETRALIDAALDGGIRRAPLESRTVLRAEVRAWALLAKIGPLGNAFASRSTAAPESLTLTVDTVGGALRVQTGT
ncbi:MAG: hypothetical protein KDC87_13620, partial [Planctomycetes bacterium]|nr:hypothetical protein [Planctomycetota bacterium]